MELASTTTILVIPRAPLLVIAVRMGTRQTDKRVHDRRINTFLHTPRDQATRNITLAAPTMTECYCRPPLRAIVRTTRPPARTSRTGSLITTPACCWLKAAG